MLIPSNSTIGLRQRRIATQPIVVPFTLVSLADRRTARHRKALQDRAVWTAGDRFVIIIANRPTHESEQIDEAPPVSGQERLMAQWPDLPGAERDSTTRDLS